MASKTKLKKSTIAALLALAFLGGLFAVGLSDPPAYLIIIYSGILVSSILTVYYWRAERSNDPKASPVGLWIVGTILIALLLLCLLPAFS